VRFQWHHARLIWDLRAASCTNRASLMLISNKKQCVWLFFISCCSVFFLRRQKFNTLPLCFVFFVCVNQYNRNACHLFLHPSVALCCFYTFFIYPVLEFVFRVFVVCMTTSTHRRAFNWWHHADLYDTTLVWYGLACSEKPFPTKTGQNHETRQNTK